MNTFTVACFAIPLIGFGRTVIKNWDTVKFIHFSPMPPIITPEMDANIEAYFMAKKKDAQTWKKRDGTEVPLIEMGDQHLANSIKMVARNCHKTGYLGDMKSDKSFLKLVGEGKRRKFRISILNVPITIDGRKEYVEVLIPTPRSKINAGFFPTDWDSRSQE